MAGQYSALARECRVCEVEARSKSFRPRHRSSEARGTPGGRVGLAGRAPENRLAFGTMEAIPEALERLARRHGLRDVYVFGSRAAEIAARVRGSAVSTSGVAPSSSDVDIAVEPLQGRTLSARDRVRLADELEGLFNALRVDLVILSEARAFLAFEIVSGELLYTGDALAQAEHELYVLRRAADLAPFQRERVAAILSSDAR